MVWIRTVSEADATGTVKEVYDHWRVRMNKQGPTADVVKVFSISPRILQAVEGLRTAIKDGASGLGKGREGRKAGGGPGHQRLTLRGVGHGELLRRATDGNVELVVQLGTDWRSADIADRDRAMLAFAEKMTRDAASMTEADVQVLRTVGITDEEILDIAVLTAYRNFITRIADALGCQESGERAGIDDRIVAALSTGKPW